jgi:AraC-like DNA-binding protein
VGHGNSGTRGFKLYLVLKGEGWIYFEKPGSKYHLRPGDCFLVTTGEKFIATSDLSVKKRTTLEEALRNAKNGILTFNGGGDLFVVSVHFNFHGHIPKIIFKGLPRAIHVPAMSEEAASLRWDIERFRAEFLSGGIGNNLVLSHLAPIILVQILRHYLKSKTEAKNWLTSLSDNRILKAIESIHGNVKKSWSLDDLAKVSGMSRAGFAVQFKKKVGLTPGEYLANWRMQVACGLLQSGGESISIVAENVGYDSLSAFSTAFNRIVGCRPGSYRKSQIPSASAA